MRFFIEIRYPKGHDLDRTWWLCSGPDYGCPCHEMEIDEELATILIDNGYHRKTVEFEN
jgi:hypothetical protein